jgi:transposase-like protein
LKQAFNIDTKDDFVFMSNREKGLDSAVAEVFPKAKHSYCCQHIADNIAVSFGNKYRPFFWQCARAKNETAFNEALKALYEVSAAAGQYVEELDHTTWTQYAFPFPRYSYDTNNINESTNNAWLEIRRLPLIQMIDAIYTLLMKTIYDRNKEHQESTELANVPLAKFKERLRSSRRFRVFESGDGIYSVQIPNTSVKYITNLRTRKCGCTYFWDYCSPCTHAITALRF